MYFLLKSPTAVLSTQVDTIHHRWCLAAMNHGIIFCPIVGQICTKRDKSVTFKIKNTEI